MNIFSIGKEVDKKDPYKLLVEMQIVLSVMGNSMEAL